MQNLELKAFCANLDEAIECVLAIGAQHQWTKRQADTYFVVPSGKLKLRQAINEPAELIAYHRPQNKSAKISDYFIYRSSHDDALLETLSRVMSIDLTVVKERTLYLWKNVRLHFDRVEQLGSFIEFEAVLEGNNNVDISSERITYLQALLKIEKEQLINVGYYELIKEQIA